MFLSGLELDASLLAAPGERTGPKWRQRATSPLVMGALIFAGTLVIVFAAIGPLWLAGVAPDLWLTSLVFATTSVGVVVPTLKEAGVSNQPYGQTILVAAFLADFITLLVPSSAGAAMPRWSCGMRVPRRRSPSSP